MELLNQCYITEEANFGNGIIYDIVKFCNFGYKHLKYYAVNQSLDDVIVYANQYGYENPTYIENVFSKFSIPGQVQQSIAYESQSSIELMNQLYEIEKLDIIEIDYMETSKYKVFYFPSMMIYEVNNMAVKLPKKVQYQNGEIKWTYDYLIFPSFQVNNDLLKDLRHLSGKELPLNVEHESNLTKRNVHRLFSVFLHNLLQYEYTKECNMSKGITNAIRVMEHDRVADNTFYQLYQSFRQNKRDTIGYTGFVYHGPLQELKLKEIAELLGFDLADIGVISQDVEKRIDFFAQYGNKEEYQPLIKYIENLNCSPFEAMDNYKDMETRRSYIRKVLFQLYMAWYDSFDNTINYIGMLEPELNLNPSICRSKSKIFWVQGDYVCGVKTKSYSPRVKKF